jgi:hypothetical protein
MILGYAVAVMCLVGATRTGHTGDHGAPEPGKTVCQAVPTTREVVTKTYSSKVQEFCLTPIGWFGNQPQCGPVRTKRVLILHRNTRDEPATKYIPVVPCTEPACAPAGAEQPVPGAVPPFVPPPGAAPGPMPSGQFPQ